MNVRWLISDELKIHTVVDPENTYEEVEVVKVVDLEKWLNHLMKLTECLRERSL